MRRWGFAAAVAIAACAVIGGVEAAPQVGELAPDFSVTTFGGRTVTLADLKGDVIVLNFWATWCGPCKRELPLLEAFFEKYNQFGFQVLAIATEDSVPEDKLRPLAAQLRIPFIKHLHGPYRVLGAVPTNYVIDRSGKLVYAKASAFEIDDLNAILIPLLQEPIPDNPSGQAGDPPPEADDKSK